MAEKGKQKQQRGPIMMLITLLLLEAGVVFLAMPKEPLLKVREKEAKAVASVLGEESAAKIKKMADNWYVASFVKTGAMKATYDFLLNQWEGKEGDLQLDDRGLSKLVDQRLDVFWLSVHQAYYRFAVMLSWLPYLFPFLFVSTIDGLLQREIRKWQFSFSSPAAHQAATKTIYYIFAVVVLSPFVPISLPPLAMPFLMGVCALSMWVSVANIQKRI